LVFATRPSTPSAWIDLLTRDDGTSVLTLPQANGEAELNVDGQAFTMVVESVTAAAPAIPQVGKEGIAWYAPLPLTGEPPKYPPAWLLPSALPADGDGSSSGVAEVPIEIGSRLPITGSPDMRLLGEAVHGFLAADRASRPRAEREVMASNILDRWGASGTIQPASLIEASDRLERFVAARWPQARRHKEVPVFSRIGDQRASGRIDLLLETDDGFVIFDHKTFPGAPDTWMEKAQEFAPQLRLYGQVVTQATSKSVQAAFIHMPVVGVVIEVNLA
jgi:ATP-dependent helicase/nuclease subunit A